MKQISIRPALAALGAATLLAACGGGGGGGGDAVGGGGGGGGLTPGQGNSSQLPSSATADSGGLVAYLKDLIANHTDSTSEPVVLGNAVLPTSEVSEPLPVN